MLDDDLRIRARRLATGQRRTEDLDRLFLGLRDRGEGRLSIREIGDFVAHRGQREKGLVTQTARDVFTSVDVWSRPLRRQPVARADVVRAVRANFRLASDQQIKKGCGMRRSIVRRRLDSALLQFERGEILRDQEMAILKYLGTTFIWKPAFTDIQLFTEFRNILYHRGLLTKAEWVSIETAKTFLTLYTIALMHGVRVTFDTGLRSELRAGFSNRQGHLEIKILITFDDAPKPIMSPICMFLTSLRPEEHCAPQLLDLGTCALPDAWNAPIEVGANGKLTLIQ